MTYRETENAQDDYGQDSGAWSRFFQRNTPRSEIAMWDYNLLRPFLLRYACRRGMLLEAGCGLGRYVFYFAKLGFDAHGIDFSGETISRAREFAEEWNLPGSLVRGNVLDIPLPDNSVSTYISLGVLEHFQEGTQAALKEAYRVLRPGGIALLTTPAKSWARQYISLHDRLRILRARVAGREIHPEPFFQYWYSLREMVRHVHRAGFIVSLAVNLDYVHPFSDLGLFDEYRVPGWIRALEKLEGYSYLPFLAGQNALLAIKPGPRMYCFFGGGRQATVDSLRRFCVPVAKKMQDHQLAEYYRRPYRRDIPTESVEWNTPPLTPEERHCEFCGKRYTTDPLFEDFGFTVNACGSCLATPYVNTLSSFTAVRLRRRTMKYLSSGGWHIADGRQKNV